MGNREFTLEQKWAINASGGSILVSAAAGSGKTTVLISRIMRMLTDRENPIDADRLLICTFTRASTAEMKSRLSIELAKELANNPNDRHLRRQRLLLQKTHITTIHGFCSACLREFFAAAGVAPDFRLGDDAELKLIRNDVLSQIVDQCYIDMDAPTHDLIELLSDKTGETSLGATITALNEYIAAYPEPEEKLMQLAELYRQERAPSDTIWGKYLISWCESFVLYIINWYERLIDDASYIPELADTYGKDFESEKKQMEQLLQTVREGDWDKISMQINSLHFPQLTRVNGNVEGKKEISAQRNYIKVDLVKKKLTPVFSVSSEQFSDDTQTMSPMVERLCALTLQYRQEYAKRKAERKLLEYNDLEQLTAKLLFYSKDGQYYRTQVAKELSDRFDEILIDEYQDTNYTQDTIFRAISKEQGDLIGGGGNMFMVGDIKQSIYGFRKAVPQLFLDRLNSYYPYDPQTPRFPAKIILGQNFRSRPEVTETVNYVFSQIMVPQRGGIDYMDGQQLIPAGKFPPSDRMKAELHLLASLDSEKNETRDLYEARYCANLIRKMVNEGFEVTDKTADGIAFMRPAVYSDFCIMRRGIKGNHGRAFAIQLGQLGIPVKVGADNGFFILPEITLILSVLRAVNNPLLDIPLAAALRSPIFGFDVDKLAEIRAAYRSHYSGKASVYTALSYAAAHGDELCSAAVELLHQLRNQAVTVSCDRLISYIYRNTGFLSAIQASENGRTKKANLLRLLEYSRAFNSGSNRGLGSFIRTIDHMMEQGDDLAAADLIQTDCVTVRTMHGAKGLEFPICIITGLGSDQNTSSINGEVITSGSLGIGMRILDSEQRVQYSNIQFDAVKNSCLSEETNEELRILYVAMTRASDKLIMLATARGKTPIATLLSTAAYSITRNGIEPFALGVKTSPGLWLSACAMRMPQEQKLRDIAGLNDHYALSCNAPLEVFIVDKDNELMVADESIADAPQEQEVCQPDEALMMSIRERLDYRYQYDGLRRVPAKVTASGAHKTFVSRPSAARPQFMSNEQLTGAQKGTALHRFMQLCDLDKARNEPQSELERLVNEGKLTALEGQSIDTAKLSKFFEQLGDMISGAERIEREWRFAVQLEPRFLPMFVENEDDAMLAEGERVILQGECDLLLVNGDSATIIDYKTDRVSSPDKLVEEYSTQLALYASAVHSTLKTKVEHCIIYSFTLNKMIKLD